MFVSLFWKTGLQRTLPSTATATYNCVKSLVWLEHLQHKKLLKYPAKRQLSAQQYLFSYLNRFSGAGKAGSWNTCMLSRDRLHDCMYILHECKSVLQPFLEWLNCRTLVFEWLWFNLYDQKKEFPCLNSYENFAAQWRVHHIPSPSLASVCSDSWSVGSSDYSVCLFSPLGFIFYVRPLLSTGTSETSIPLPCPCRSRKQKGKGSILCIPSWI